MMSENVLPEEKYEKVSDSQQIAEKAYLTHDCHVDWRYKILCCKTESDLARMSHLSHLLRYKICQNGP